jgi:hypothetical protein
VLVGIGVSVAGFFAVQVAQKAGEAIEENPVAAAARLITAVSPDIEFVSANEDGETVTIREVQSGKEITITLDDLKNGNISFSTNEGDSMSISANEDVRLPGWVPIFQPSTQEGGASFNSGGTSQVNVNLETSRSIGEVLAFYEREFAAAGLKVQSKTQNTTQGRDSLSITGVNEDGSRAVTVVGSGADGKTSVLVSVKSQSE